MSLLIIGLLLFSGTHLVPAVCPRFRTALVERLGLWPFKVLFSIILTGSVACIVLGWQVSKPGPVYMPPEWGRNAAFLLVLLTFILFVVPYIKTNIRRFLRHAQLSSVVLWSFGHLLANGDSRSLVLFSWLAIWAFVEMIGINHREGEWKKPPAVPVKFDVLAVLGGAVLYAVVLAAHPYFTGVALV